MRRVVTNIPNTVIRQIGSAQGVGWKKWHLAVDLIVKGGVDPEIPADIFDNVTDRDTRFAVWLEHLRKLERQKRHKTQPTRIVKERHARSVTLQDGRTRIGEVRRNGGAVHLCTDPRETEFSQWLDANGEELLARLYNEFAEQSRS